MISDAVLVDALGELARRLAVSGDELWIRPRRLTTAQLEELTRTEGIVLPIAPEPVRQPDPTLVMGKPPSLPDGDPWDAFEPEPTSSRFMSEAPNRRERYVVKQDLGMGGMGRVIECEDQELGRRVALKAVRWDLRERAGLPDHLEREARLTAGLEHPNIIPVYDAGRKTGVGP